jgi:hypothetical protein
VIIYAAAVDRRMASNSVPGVADRPVRLFRYRLGRARFGVWAGQDAGPKSMQ